MKTAVADHWGLGIGKPSGVKERRALRFKLPNTIRRGRPGEATASTQSWRYRTRSRSQPTKGGWTPTTTETAQQKPPERTPEAVRSAGQAEEPMRQIS